MTGGSGSGRTKVMVKSMAEKRNSRHRQSWQLLAVVVRRKLHASCVSLHPGGTVSVVTTAGCFHVFFPVY
jgi:hypothetical protein